MFLLTRSSRYYYDGAAVREDAEYGRRDTAGVWRGGAYVNQKTGQDNSVGTGLANSVTGRHPETGRNLRAVWTISTQGFPDSHFYTPNSAGRALHQELCTSERGCCSQCGKPWVREARPGLGLGAYNDHSMDAVAGMGAPSPSKGEQRRD